jgi:hypothetical protein
VDGETMRGEWSVSIEASDRARETARRERALHARVLKSCSRLNCDDLLAVDPALRGGDAQAEVQRRAQACLANFGERAGDRIIRGERYGITHRH